MEAQLANTRLEHLSLLTIGSHPNVVRNTGIICTVGEHRVCVCVVGGLYEIVWWKQGNSDGIDTPKQSVDKAVHLSCLIIKFTFTRRLIHASNCGHATSPCYMDNMQLMWCLWPIVEMTSLA